MLGCGKRRVDVADMKVAEFDTENHVEPHGSIRTPTVWSYTPQLSQNINSGDGVVYSVLGIGQIGSPV